MEAVLSNDSSLISNVLNDYLTPINGPDERTNSYDMSASDVLNFETLVKAGSHGYSQNGRLVGADNRDHRVSHADSMLSSKSSGNKAFPLVRSVTYVALGIPLLVEGMASLTASFLCQQQVAVQSQRVLARLGNWWYSTGSANLNLN